MTHKFVIQHKKVLLFPFFLVLKSYISDRSFHVKVYLTNYWYKLYKCRLGMLIIQLLLKKTGIMQRHHTCMLQVQLNTIERWFKKWWVDVNIDKLAQVTYILRRDIYPSVNIKGNTIFDMESYKFFGLHVDWGLI